MEAGQQSEEGVSMGSSAVIFVLLVAIAGMVIGWKADRDKTRPLKRQVLELQGMKLILECRQRDLEAEIQRLRKIPLTQPPEKVDNSTIKAKSSADVRRLTEAAFGLQPEIGEQNDIE
jgi:hypothetical protein